MCVALIIACLPSLRTLLLGRNMTGGSTGPTGGYHISKKYGNGANSYARNSRLGTNTHVKLEDLSDSSHFTKIEAGHKQPTVTTMYYGDENSSEEVLRGPGIAVNTNISVTSERLQHTKEVF